MSILYRKIIKAQSGIKAPSADTTGYYQRSVDIMNKYKDLNSVARALDTRLNNGGIEFIDKEGNRGRGSHYMGTASMDGVEYAFPSIVQDTETGDLRYIEDWREALKYNKDREELIPLGTDRDFAEYFSTVGYKYKFDKKDYDEAMEAYNANKK